jgi:molybdate transport system ATP-binding protein
MTPALSSASILDVKIAKSFGDFTVDVAFTAGAGLTALFGPSGAGKTTIVNVLAGLETPDNGFIKINGTKLFDGDAGINTAPNGRQLGYVFQDARLFPHMSVERNLRYGMTRATENTNSIAWNDVIRTLDLAHLLDRRPHNLSGGEKQRVAIGRALLANPKLLLMDEPLSSLDPLRRLEVMPFIEKMRDEFSIPIVYVTHTVAEIIRLADTVVVLDHGRVVAYGRVEDVLSRLDVQAEFESTGAEPPDFGTVLTGVLETNMNLDGLSQLDFAGEKILVPQLKGNQGDRVRIRIRARDVALALEAPRRISILNAFKGRVTEVIKTGPAHVDVQLETEGGTRIWSRITRKSQRDLNIAVDTVAWALIKSVALEAGLPALPQTTQADHNKHNGDDTGT